MEKVRTDPMLIFLSGNRPYMHYNKLEKRSMFFCIDSADKPSDFVLKMLHARSQVTIA